MACAVITCVPSPPWTTSRRLLQVPRPRSFGRQAVVGLVYDTVKCCLDGGEGNKCAYQCRLSCGYVRIMYVCTAWRMSDIWVLKVAPKAMLPLAAERQVGLSIETLRQARKRLICHLETSWVSTQTKPSRLQPLVRIQVACSQLEV